MAEARNHGQYRHHATRTRIRMRMRVMVVVVVVVVVGVVEPLVQPSHSCAGGYCVKPHHSCLM